MEQAPPSTNPQVPAGSERARPATASNRSIRNTRRATALVAVLLLLSGAAFSWGTWRTEKELELRHYTSLVELGTQSLESYFSNFEKALGALSRELLASGPRIDPPRAREKLRLFAKTYSEFRNVTLFRLDGQVLASADFNGPASIGATPSFISSREELQNGRTLSIARPLFGVMLKEWIISLRYGLRDERGKLLYIVSAALPLSSPQMFWKDAPLPQNAALAIIRDDGYLVSRYPIPGKTELENVYGKPQSGAFAELLLRGQLPKNGLVEAVSKVTGFSSLFVFRRLSNYPLTFIMTSPVSNLRSLWWQKVRLPYLLMLIVLSGGFFIYRWMLAQQIAWETERAAVHDTLEKMSRTDSLTGVLNRRAMMEELTKELARSARTREPASAISFDLDHFKSVNDRFGHSGGDKTLQAFVGAVQRELRPYDALGRFGGEEFLLLLPHTGASEARTIAERIRAALERQPIGPNSEVVTVSAGIAHSLEEKIHCDLEQLLAISDARLYEAKRTRNTVVGGAVVDGA